MTPWIYPARPSRPPANPWLSAPSGRYTANPPDINLDFVHSLARASQTAPMTCPININNCVPTLTAHKPTAKP